MRVGARKCSEHHTVKLVLLANNNFYEVNSEAFFFSNW